MGFNGIDACTVGFDIDPAHGGVDMSTDCLSVGQITYIRCILIVEVLEYEYVAWYEKKKRKSASR